MDLQGKQILKWIWWGEIFVGSYTETEYDETDGGGAKLVIKSNLCEFVSRFKD